MQLCFLQAAAGLALLSVASANLHDSCACHNSGDPNLRITAKACELYASKQHRWGKGDFDASSGQCVKSTDSDQIAGKEWEAACREAADTGFKCADGKGLYCKAPPNEVRGRC
ncbi:hypothetical protein CGCSCA5_v015091 [Colletotrichum siamense]|uniref:uncharacterized protein n=1 Tax=Colletotrichum siamense TaxID=690259 RepID=UPI001872BB38|nr:uncharacterized protein CGCS363_v015181 [Colletotrichum siamense]XP_036487773.1 uncharacterized protein CGCS363_v015168 [Colletotrichum siamense]KAF4805734.1 hypothetical protein CGCSCA5_v015091 [Colletotrichum siamense]KAF4859678.1 hypothetical protein CGCSCA1_v015115 [Colletotrichum siamense]KAF5482681.1 hypothetical protein CGCS363_v015181 [Colletotrichum siamense]KAF5482795.1 hypothetical protein CGCS363_v015168 [Colletotrichum siamense]